MAEGVSAEINIGSNAKQIASDIKTLETQISKLESQLEKLAASQEKWEEKRRNATEGTKKYTNAMEKAEQIYDKRIALENQLAEASEKLAEANNRLTEVNDKLAKSKDNVTKATKENTRAEEAGNNVTQEQENILASLLRHLKNKTDAIREVIRKSEEYNTATSNLTDTEKAYYALAEAGLLRMYGAFEKELRILSEVQSARKAQNELVREEQKHEKASAALKEKIIDQFKSESSSLREIIDLSKNNNLSYEETKKVLNSLITLKKSGTEVDSQYISNLITEVRAVTSATDALNAYVDSVKEAKKAKDTFHAGDTSSSADPWLARMSNAAKSAGGIGAASQPTVRSDSGYYYNMYHVNQAHGGMNGEKGVGTFQGKLASEAAGRFYSTVSNTYALPNSVMHANRYLDLQLQAQNQRRAYDEAYARRNNLVYGANLADRIDSAVSGLSASERESLRNDAYIAFSTIDNEGRMGAYRNVTATGLNFRRNISAANNRLPFTTIEARRAYQDSRVASAANGWTGSVYRRRRNDSSESISRIQMLMAYFGGGKAKEAFNTVADFREALSSAQAVVGASEKDYKKLEQASIALGKSTKFTAKEAAEGIKYLGMAGLKTDDILKALPSTLDLASAGELDMGRAADIATNIMAGFNMKAEEFGEAADIISYTANNSNTNVEQLASGMKYVGPAASAVNMSLKDTAAVMGTLANSGIQATMSGTSLRRILVALSKNPTASARKALADLGMTEKDISLKSNDLFDILDKLSKKKVTGDFGLKEATAIFGQIAATSVLTLVDNNDKLKEFRIELEKSAGAAKSVSEQKMDNLKGDIIKIKSALEGVVLELNNISDFESYARPFLRAVKDNLNNIPAIFEMISKGSEISRKNIIEPVSLLNDEINKVIDTSKFWSGVMTDLKDKVLPELGVVLAGTIGIGIADWAFRAATHTRGLADAAASLVAIAPKLGPALALTGAVWGIGKMAELAKLVGEIEESAKQRLSAVDSITKQTAQSSKAKLLTDIDNLIGMDSIMVTLFQTGGDNSVTERNNNAVIELAKNKALYSLSDNKPEEFNRAREASIYEKYGVSEEDKNTLQGLFWGKWSKEDASRILEDILKYEELQQEHLRNQEQIKASIANGTKTVGNPKIIAPLNDEDTISLSTYTNNYRQSAAINEFIKKYINDDNIPSEIRTPEALENVYNIGLKTGIEPDDLLLNQENKEILEWRQGFVGSFGGKSGKKFGSAYSKNEAAKLREQQKAEREKEKKLKQLELAKAKYYKITGVEAESNWEVSDIQYNIDDFLELQKLEKETSKKMAQAEKERERQSRESIKEYDRKQKQLLKELNASDKEADRQYKASLKQLEKERREQERLEKQRQKEQEKALKAARQNVFKTMFNPFIKASYSLESANILNDKPKATEAVAALSKTVQSNISMAALGVGGAGLAASAYNNQMNINPAFIKLMAKKEAEERKEQARLEREYEASRKALENDFGKLEAQSNNLATRKNLLQTPGSMKDYNNAVKLAQKSEKIKELTRDILENNSATEQEKQKAIEMAEAIMRENEEVSRLEASKQKQSEFYKSLASDMTNAIVDAHNLRDALQNLGDVGVNIMKRLAAQWIESQIEKMLFNIGSVGKGSSGSSSGVTEAASLLLPGIMNLSFAHGGAFSSGTQLTAYARGGIVNKPTIFPMKHGLGLMGEAGAEAVMPLRRTASGDLGVQVSGSRGDGVVINNQITINAEGGTKEQNEDAASRIDSKVRQAMDDMVMSVLIREKRPGGALYR